MMKKLIGICTLLLSIMGACLAQDAPSSASVSPVVSRSPSAEGIAVVKSVGNLLHGTQNDPTPWECEPTLLYAAKYPMSQRESDYVLDFCSVLALSKRGAVGSNYIDVTNNVASEIPRTQKKLQRYRDADQFFLEVSGMRLAYQGKVKQYQLSWRVPRLEVLSKASSTLMAGYLSDLRASRNSTIGPNGFSTVALGEDYKRTGMEFFDRKYGKGASISLSRPLPWPTNQGIVLTASDDKTEYALENLTSNPPQREIDGTTFYQLSLTGNLFFGLVQDGDAIRAVPQFVEVWLYKKVVRIPLATDGYAITCKTSGLFGRSYKCE